MQKFLISLAALQFTLAAAAAQPAPLPIASPPIHIDLPIVADLAAPLGVVIKQLPASLIAGPDVEMGIASIYSGGRTANGEQTLAGGMTAAHRTLPFGTRVRVTNRSNGNFVVVRINDRGPFIRGRIIDITPEAARALGFSGLASVSVALVSAVEID